MVRSASSSSLQRKHLFVALGTLLGLASGAAHAQQDPEAISVPVTGRAPAVAISGIVNESVPASAPRVGHVLRIDASVTDADGDAITSTTYRWLRDDVEVANGATYTPVAADAGLTLVAEVTANTDPDATDPAMGKAQVDVSIVDNAAPTADLMSIAGTIQVGEQITGMYRYSDPDNDLEGPSTFRWFRADNAEDAGTPIIGETGRNYRLKVADEGKWISFEVTPHSNTGDPRIGAPAVVRSAVPVAPANGQAPTATGVVVNGTPEVKSVLTGDYAFNDVDGDQEAGSTFQWYRADTVGGLRTEIPGATSQTYALQIADEGKFVFFEVTPRSATGEPKAGTAVLANTATAVAATNGAAPTASGVTVSGNAEVKSTLTGVYTFDDTDGDQEGVSTFKWYRADDSSGTNLIEISGETAQSYTLRIADEGKFVFFEVTPRSATGVPKVGAPVTTNTATAVAATNGAAPTATGLAISGTVLVGSTLEGTYVFDDSDGDQEGSTTFQWYRADDDTGANRQPILNATGRSYTVVADDQSKHLVFEVTPVSKTGLPKSGSPERTTTTVAVPGSAPEASNVQIIGTPSVVGATLTGSFTYTDADLDGEGAHIFKWYRADDSAGANPVEIAGANEATYVVAGEDQTKHLVFEVTPVSATGNPNKGTPVQMVAVEAVVGTAPVISNVLITGRATVGSTVKITYTYSDADGDQEGATGFVLCRKDVICGLTTTDTYVITEDDYYRTLNGHLEPRSLTGAPNQGVNAPIPEFPADGKRIREEQSPISYIPAFPDPLEVGSVITATTNYVDLNDDPEGASIFQWYRATDSAGVNRVPIDGAVTNTYTVTEADIHKYLVLTYTPVAAEGRPDTLVGLQQERVSVIVSGHKPVATGLQITGTPALGAQVLGRYDYADDDGDQEGTPVYKWYRATDSSGLNKTLISGANSATYTVAPPDSDKYLVFEITPVSLTGHPKVGDPATIVASTAVPTIPNTPPVASDLSITGISRVGEVLTGHYSYSDVDEDVESGTTFQWYRSDNATGSGRVAIPGATGKTYMMAAGDLDKFMVFEVTPRSATGSPGAPQIAVGSSGVMTYEVSGYHSLQPGVTASMEINVAGRASSGKAGTPVTTSYVHAYPEALSFVLVAPDGTTFPLIRGPEVVRVTTLVDLSAYSSINGKWQVRVTQNGYPVGMGGQFNFFSITF